MSQIPNISVTAYSELEFRRLAHPYRQKIVDMGSWISKRRAGDPTCRTGRRGRRPYEGKIAVPKGPPLPGEVPDEA